MPPKVKQKTFQEWAEQISWHDAILKSPHPFGASRNKVQIKQEGNEIQEVRREDLEAAQQAGLVASASASGATLQAASQEKNKDGQTVLLVVGNAGSLLTSAFAMMNHKMPAVVTIKVHNATDPDAGLLEVTMSGYGHKVQAALSILSRFNLRVSSSYVAHEDGPSLQYGNIIDDKINVEGHCQPLLNHCRNRHKKLCEKPTWFTKLRPPMGEHFRLIDVKKRTVVQMNVNKNGIFSPQTMLPKYAALSYVWGKTGKKALRLHLDNASRLADGIDKVSDEDNIKVARTILDAIDVTRRLGIPYLWADSLCVIQEDLDDDQELPEISSQLGQMDSIFGHASIVIVAAAGTHAEAGLPGITSSREPGQIALKVRDDVNVLLAVQYGDSYGKWDTRAWTLQEKLLSRRMLVFDGNYVSFHCRHGILREDMPAIHAGNGPPRIPYLSMPPDSDAPRVAKFSLRLKRHSRTETLWGKANGEALTSERTFEIVEAEILDSSKNVVGYAIPTDRKQSIMPDHLYQLVLLSESQYWGNEERIDVVDYPLFNVMVVKWDTREEFATRLGLGKISKSAWKDAKPFTRRVILK
ncbi:Heterokaryon incompatibility protein [Colletotrichum sp. SAR 10_70]|nr:Heterokaryon incompatibility protein [Colletotrichum sp. SAR 10_71]KAI8186333.1 Heterokaryon incompatibility protein [Colletotrichum sp. SAR 10_70]